MIPRISKLVGDIASKAFPGHAKHDESVEGPEIAETPPPEEDGRKRARGDEEVQLIRSIKKARVREVSPPRNADYRAGYAPQQTATSDLFDERADVRTGVKRRMAGVSGFKPRNTLYENRHVARPQSENEKRMFASIPESHQKKSSVASSGQLPLAGGQRRHIGRTTHPLGDRYWDERVASPPKRQRMTNETVAHEDEEIKYDTHSDQEEDYTLGGRIEAVNGKKVSSSPISSGRSVLDSSTVPHFGSTEFANASRYTDPVRVKKKRKPMPGSQNSQQVSQRSSPTEAVANRNTIGSSHRRREPSIIEILDDDNWQLKQASNPKAKKSAIPAELSFEQPASRHPDPKPPRDSSKTQIPGPEDLQRRHIEGPPSHKQAIRSNSSTIPRKPKNVSTASGKVIDGASDDLRESSSPKKTTSQLQESAMPRDSACNFAELGEVPGNVSQKSSTAGNFFAQYAKQKEPGARMRTEFKRDCASKSIAAKNEPSKDTMLPPQPFQNMSNGTEDSLSTEDELQGGNTVGTVVIRQPASPKSSAPQPRDLSSTKGRSTTPRHTPLNGNEVAKTSKYWGDREQQSSKPRKNNVPMCETSICVLAIFCRGCWQSQPKALKLVWDLEEKSFRAELAGDVLQLPGKEKMFTISPVEARSYTGSHESTLVVLKGASSDNSNGRILIEFPNVDVAETFQDLLLEVAGDNVRIGLTDKHRVEQIFNNLQPEIRADHEKQKKISAPAQRDRELAVMKQRYASRGTLRASADSDRDQHRSSRASQMMALDESEANTKRPEPVREGITTSGTGNETRRSTRQPKPVKPRTPTPPPPERWTEQNPQNRWLRSVVYPAKGAKQVTVDFDDLERLDEGQFFNDNVISFALRQIQEEMSEATRTSVHFFNTFFYSALTSKVTGRGINYNAVKRWTKNVDLFGYPFVVIPVNIDLHWFVIIVVNLPNIERKLVADDDDIGPRADENVGAMEDLSIEDTGEHTAEANIFTYDDDGKVQIDLPSSQAAIPDAPSKAQVQAISGKKSKSKNRAPRKADPNKSTIITLDSFGSAHPREVRLVKLYLSEEAREKRNMAIDPNDTTQLSGLTAKGIPVQENFCDCGVYLVGYIQAFAKNPREFVNKIFNREMDQQQDFANFDPSAKRIEIRDSLLKLHEQQDLEHHAAKREKLIAQSVSSNQTTTAKVSNKPQAAASHDVSHPAPPSSSTMVEPSNGIKASDVDDAPGSATEEQYELEVNMPRALSDAEYGLNAPEVPLSDTRSMHEPLNVENNEYDSNSPLMTSTLTVADEISEETILNEKPTTRDANTPPPTATAATAEPATDMLTTAALNVTANTPSSGQEVTTTPVGVSSNGTAGMVPDSDSGESSAASNIIVSSPVKAASAHGTDYSILGPLAREVGMSPEHDTRPSIRSEIKTSPMRSHRRKMSESSNLQTPRQRQSPARSMNVRQQQPTEQVESSPDVRKTRTSPRISRKQITIDD